MSATILQFIPRPNPNRDLNVVHIQNVQIVHPSPLLDTSALIDTTGVALFYQIETDTAPCEYSAPSNDLA